MQQFPFALSSLNSQLVSVIIKMIIFIFVRKIFNDQICEYCASPDEESGGLDLHVLAAAHLPGQQDEGVQDVVSVLGARLHEDSTETKE